MDLTQIILSSAIFVLTTILALVGIQVFLIFKEVRQSIHKVNKILDDTGLVSESVARQLNNVSGLVSGVQGLIGLAKMLLHRNGDEGKEQREDLLLEEKNGNENFSQVEPEIASPIRRFFTRAGKRLS